MFRYLSNRICFETTNEKDRIKNNWNFKKQFLLKSSAIMNKSIILILLIILSPKAFSQIPNNDFESWTSVSGYPSPTDWDNLNDITNTSGIYTCIQGAPGYLGASYLYLMSKNIPGKGIVPGIAVCGELDTLTYKAKSGFPFSSRPQDLTYYMQYMPYDPSDSSSVKVLLSKWNVSFSQRDTIAYGETYFNAMAHSWIYRTTPLSYYSGDAPDSAMIIISSSDNTPIEYSYIYVDNLQFIGSIAAIEENYLNLTNFNVFPNPTNGNFFIEYELLYEDKVSIAITDVLGRTVYTSYPETKLIGHYKNEMNIELKNGVYIILLRTEKAVAIKKIVKNN